MPVAMPVRDYLDWVIDMEGPHMEGLSLGVGGHHSLGLGPGPHMKERAS